MPCADVGVDVVAVGGEEFGVIGILGIGNEECGAVAAEPEGAGDEVACGGGWAVACFLAAFDFAGVFECPQGVTERRFGVGADA